MSNQNKSGKFANGALLGAMFGAALGLLFAPKTGAETRKELKAEANKLKKKPEVQKAIKEVEKLKNKPEVKRALNEVNKFKKQMEPIVKKEIKKAKAIINSKTKTQTKVAVKKNSK